MSNCGRFVLCIVMTLVVSGCGGNRNLIVLLPDADGKVGEVVVSNAKGTLLLNEANQATSVESADKAPSTPKKMPQKKIDAIFGQALAAQPPQPIRYILYFETDSVQLRTESSKLFPEIIATIEARRSVDISVIGHTDTAGTNNYNFRLSEDRSAEVARILISQGINAATLSVTSHGENNPLIKTRDGISELRNRRVEVTVR